jgi:ribosomal protein S18 acetylase RimI-like enzyme
MHNQSEQGIPQTQPYPLAFATMSNIHIRLPTKSEQTDQQFIHHVVKLVNEAYAGTESSFYKPGALRTNNTEVHNWLTSGHYYLAFKPDSNYPIGSVRVHKLDPSVTEIGILTVNRDARALGLGHSLMCHAEEVAIAEGAKTARLEMLVPIVPQSNDVKAYLRRWYGSLGYDAVGRASIVDVVPQIAENFEEGSEFLIMEKDLKR